MISADCERLHNFSLFECVFVVTIKTYGLNGLRWDLIKKLSLAGGGSVRWPWKIRNRGFKIISVSFYAQRQWLLPNIYPVAFIGHKTYYDNFFSVIGFDPEKLK